MQSEIFIVLLVLNVADFQNVIGRSCAIPGVGVGKCTLVQQCHSAREALKKGVLPKMCDFNGHDSVVCCASGSANMLRSKAIEKYEQYKKNNTIKVLMREPEVAKPMVEGGMDASVDEFPHMAALGYGNASDIQWQCGGSLISEKFVLTAAHCLQAGKLGVVQHVLLGHIYLPNSPNRDRHGHFTVKRIISHPSYQPPSVYHDVGLLELNKSATFSRSVKLACLYIQSEVADPQPVIATGWGYTQYGSSPSSILQKVDLDFFTINECRNMYKSSKKRMLNGIQTDKQMCVGGRNVEKDTCQGDSGGPVQFRTSEPNELYEIIGVTSFGKACGVANVPGVYSKVSYYVPWIESIVWP